MTKVKVFCHRHEGQTLDAPAFHSRDIKCILKKMFYKTCTIHDYESFPIHISFNSRPEANIKRLMSFEKRITRVNEMNWHRKLSRRVIRGKRLSWFIIYGTLNTLFSRFASNVMSWYMDISIISGEHWMESDIDIFMTAIYSLVNDVWFSFLRPVSIRQDYKWFIDRWTF